MYEKHGETITAQTFLDALQSDALVIIFTNCTIEGVVDPFSIELERDENDRILLNKKLSCIGCTFKNIVNFRTVVFQQEVDFRRTLFEADLDFDEAILHGPCAFREAIFQRRADFHSAIFYRSASFWRARFHNVADFHGVQFSENAVFHEVNFLNEVNFRRVQFQGILDCTGTWFPEKTAFNNATFFGTANFTAAQFVSVAAFRDVEYTADTLFHAVKAKLSRKQHRPTEFYLDSQHIDEVASPFSKDTSPTSSSRVRSIRQIRYWQNYGDGVLTMVGVWHSGRSGLFSLRLCSRSPTCPFRHGCHPGCKTGLPAFIKRRVPTVVSH